MQLEFVLGLMNEELVLRVENRRQCPIKRAGFPVYKTFEDYSYQHVKFPPAFSRNKLEALGFIQGQNNLVLYDPVGVAKSTWRLRLARKPAIPGIKRSSIP